MLELGKIITSFFNLAKLASPDDWTGHSCLWFGRPNNHQGLVELMEQWHSEFLRAETELSHLPDGWAEMSRLLDQWRSLLSDPVNDVHDDPAMLGVRLRHHIRMGRISYVPLVTRAMRLSISNDLGLMWYPVWAKLMPAIRGRVGRLKQAPELMNEWQKLALLFEKNKARQGFSIVNSQLMKCTLDSNIGRVRKNVQDALVAMGSDVKVAQVNKRGIIGLRLKSPIKKSVKK